MPRTLEVNLPIGIRVQAVCEQLSDTQDTTRDGLSPTLVWTTRRQLMLVVHKERLLVPNAVHFELRLEFGT